jgi:predicted ATPase
LYASVQLFIDRAQSAQPDFQVTNANAAAVAALCQRLEGIPLALELAAARIRTLPPAQILAHLEHRLDFLTSQRRDATPRHRTLRAAIGWSYQLLPPELQHFFARLSVFRGGWTLEAAAAICEEPLALDYLTQLQECSLVLADEGSHGVRFRMLETLREYAAEQLAPEEQDRLQRHHAEHCLAQTARLETEQDNDQPWRDRLAPDLDNLRAALAWGLAREPEFAVRLAVELRDFWVGAAQLAEGYELLTRALGQAPDLPAELRARAFSRAGGIASQQGHFTEAKGWYEEALKLRRALGEAREIVGELWELSNTLFLLVGQLP